MAGEDDFDLSAEKSIRTIRDLEKDAIKDALHGCNGNKSKAARMLGISRKAMYKRLRESQQREYAL